MMVNNRVMHILLSGISTLLDLEESSRIDEIMTTQSWKNIEDHYTILGRESLKFPIKKLKCKVLEQCSISLKSKEAKIIDTVLGKSRMIL
jgi:hypothetical protein